MRTSVRIGQWNAGFGSRLTKASTLSLGNRSTTVGDLAVPSKFPILKRILTQAGKQDLSAQKTYR